MKRRLFLHLSSAAAAIAALTAGGGGGGGASTTAEASGAPAAAAAAAASTTAAAAAPAAALAAPTPTANPAPATAPEIAISTQTDVWLQTGGAGEGYWMNDGGWGAGNLTRGTYTGLNGSQFEQQIGVSNQMGPNGEVAARMAWKWPTGTTEIKSFPALLVGNKPGFFNTSANPGGLPVRLLDGTNSQVTPSGKTPGSFFPLQLPIDSLKSSFAYKHNETPTGHGHLSYDIWLQETPEQVNGFLASPITHEIMIPLTNWGGYGDHITGRNAGWYDHDVTIDGKLFHVYVNKGADGAVRADFYGGWKFIVFQPDQPIEAGTLDLAKFINYVATRKDAFGTPWATGREYAVSAELGVEPHDGTGDLTLYNYRVWK